MASPASRAAVAEAAGVDPADMDSEHFSTHFDSDGKVRAVIQALRQTTKDLAEASETARKDLSIENIAAVQLKHRCGIPMFWNTRLVCALRAGVR